MSNSTPDKTPYEEQQEQDLKDEIARMKREMLYLTRKAASNPLAASYYTQITDLLEDLLMLDLAQKAAETHIKFQTRNKAIVVDDASLSHFRSEMEKAKILKLVAGVLSLTGHFNVEAALDRVMDSLYLPRDTSVKSNPQQDILPQIRKMLEEYSRKIEKAINKNRKVL